MHTIVHYVREYHHPLEDRPFTAVDSLVLSYLAYLRLEHCGMGKPGRGLQLGSLAAEMENQRLLENVPNKGPMLELIYGVATSPRFRWLTATRYVNQVEAGQDKQFSATTFLFEDGTRYLAFRGTDGSLVGWKENFNMTFLPAIPAQQESAAYLAAIAAASEGPLLLGGHSKGGNLAVYAAACADPAVQDRILAVHSHDGPGFQPEFFDQPGYARVQDRLHRTLPESAYIGLLLEQRAPYTVVASLEQGLAQHSGLTWGVEDGQFVEKEAVSKETLSIVQAINQWAQTLGADQSERIVNTLFELLRATNATTISALLLETVRNASNVYKAFMGLAPDTKQLLHDKFEELDKIYEEQRAVPAPTSEEAGE